MLRLNFPEIDFVVSVGQLVSSSLFSVSISATPELLYFFRTQPREKKKKLRKMASQVPSCPCPFPTSVSTILCIFLPPSHVWSNGGVQVSSTHRVCGKNGKKKNNSRVKVSSLFVTKVSAVAAETSSVTCVAVVWSSRLKSSHRSLRASHHPP